MAIDFAASNSFDVEYELRLFAPRSEDPEEAKLLRPLEGAPHGDAFVVSTRRGKVGKPLLEMGEGRSSRTNPLKKEIDSGELSVTVLDQRTGDGNSERWFTAFIGGPDGINRLAGVRAVILERLGPDHERIMWVGRVDAVEMQERIRMRLRIRDMASDFDVTLFGAGGQQKASTQVLPPGPLWNTQWGGADQTPLALGFMARDKAEPTKHSRFYVAPNSFRKNSTFGSPVAARGDIGTRVNSLLWAEDRSSGDFGVHPGLRLNIVTSPGGALDGKAYAIRSGNEFEKSSRLFLDFLILEPLPEDDPQHEPLHPEWPNSTTKGPFVRAYISRAGGASETSPVLLEGTPLEVLTSILDGTHTRSGEGVPFDTDSLQAAFANHPLGRVRYRITEPKKLLEWLAEDFAAPLGIGFALRNVFQKGAAPRQELFFYDARGAAAVAQVESGQLLTIGSQDLAPAAPTWRQARRDAVQILRIETTNLQISNAATSDTFPGAKDDILPIGNVGIAENGVTFVETAYVQPDVQGEIGAKVHVMPAPGFITTSADTEEDVAKVQSFMRDIADDYRRLYGNGPIYVGLKALRTPSTETCEVGSWRILDIPELPNPETRRRGGPRVGLCITRDETGPTIGLGFMEFSGTASTVSSLVLSNLTESPQNEVFAVDVQGVLSGDEPVELWGARVDFGSGNEPGVNDPLWQRLAVSDTERTGAEFSAIATGGSGPGLRESIPFDGTWYSGPLPPGVRLWVRGRQVSTSGAKTPGPWVTAGFVEHGELFVGPTDLAVSEITKTSARISWTPSSAFPVEVSLASPAGGSAQVVVLAPPGANSIVVNGLSVSQFDEHRISLVHVDAPGRRRSTASSIVFDRLADTEPQPAGPAIASITKVDPTPNAVPDENSVQGAVVRIAPAAAGWPVELEAFLGPDPENDELFFGSVLEAAEVLSPEFRVMVPTEGDVATLWIRARHVGNVTIPGPWTAMLEVTPGLHSQIDPGLLPPGPDSFVGILPVEKGGTGRNSHAANGILVGAGTNKITSIRGSETGQLLIWDGSAWVPSRISFETPLPVPPTAPQNPIVTPCASRWDVDPVSAHADEPYGLGAAVTFIPSGLDIPADGALGIVIGDPPPLTAQSFSFGWRPTGCGAALPINGEVSVGLRVRAISQTGPLTILAYRADDGTLFGSHEFVHIKTGGGAWAGVWQSMTGSVSGDGTVTNWNILRASFQGVPDVGLIIVINDNGPGFQAAAPTPGENFIGGIYTPFTGVPPAPLPLDSSPVDGILAVSSGGTGVSSLPEGSIAIGRGALPVDAVVGVSIGDLLAWDGSQWAAPGVIGDVGVIGPLRGATPAFVLRPSTADSTSSVQITDGTGVPILTVSGNGTLTAPLGTLRQGTNTRLSNIATLYNAAAGFTKLLAFQTGGLNRWVVGAGAQPELGANAGTSFQVTRYSDAGAVIGNPITIARATGVVVMESGISVTAGDISVTAGTVRPLMVAINNSAVPPAPPASGGILYALGNDIYWMCAGGTARRLNAPC